MEIKQFVVIYYISAMHSPHWAAEAKSTKAGKSYGQTEKHTGKQIATNHT